MIGSLRGHLGRPHRRHRDPARRGRRRLPGGRDHADGGRSARSAPTCSSTCTPTCARTPSSSTGSPTTTSGAASRRCSGRTGSVRPWPSPSSPRSRRPVVDGRVGGRRRHPVRRARHRPQDGGPAAHRPEEPARPARPVDAGDVGRPRPTRRAPRPGPPWSSSATGPTRSARHWTGQADDLSVEELLRLGPARAGHPVTPSGRAGRCCRRPRTARPTPSARARSTADRRPAATRPKRPAFDPAALTSSSASPSWSSTCASCWRPPGSAASRSTTCCSPARRARQDVAGRHRGRRDGRGPPDHLGSGAGARRRPGRAAHRPPGGRRPLHRRDPPAAPLGRGGPLPGHGGRQAGHPDRQGPDGPLHPPRPAPLHPGRGDHPHRLVAGPLRDRFGFVGRLDLYHPTSCRPSWSARPRILGVQIDAAGAGRIAERSRGTPRIANRLLRRVRDFVEVRGDGAITGPTAAEGLVLFGVDELGLDKVDRAILDALCRRFGGRPVGLTTLAQCVGEEPDTIEDAYEPYLLQQGLIQRTPRGRVATARAWAHLGLVPGAAPCSERTGRTPGAARPAGPAVTPRPGRGGARSDRQQHPERGRPARVSTMSMAPSSRRPRPWRWPGPARCPRPPRPGCWPPGRSARTVGSRPPSGIPGPSSRTSSRAKLPTASVWATTRPPDGVNLQALDDRLARSWVSRAGSPWTMTGSGATAVNERPRLAATAAMASHASGQLGQVAVDELHVEPPGLAGVARQVLGHPQELEGVAVDDAQHPSLLVVEAVITRPTAARQGPGSR